ncbi:MAG: hypothetical protein ACI9OJ_004024, partial [Myxococcota bacterium]
MTLFALRADLCDRMIGCCGARVVTTVAIHAGRILSGEGTPLFVRMTRRAWELEVGASQREKGLCVDLNGLHIRER